MIAVFVNMATVLCGSLIGIFFRSHIRESIQNALMAALALCTIVIGIRSALASENVLCLIICMALGTALGELLRIDDGIERAGEYLKNRFVGKNARTARFTAAITMSVL